jgi:hypothetical protein
MPYAEGMNQNALLNPECYISFFHFPISEHENLPQIKYITYSTTNKLHLLSQIIIVKRPTCVGQSFHHQELKTAYTEMVYVKQLLLPAAMVLCAMLHAVSFVHGRFAGKCILTGSTE